ncbi:MAG: Coenzyme F420 hydrogenase/dehydrogenase, beta subunit C-terminal domain [Planctomycetota bacterium]
MAVLTLKVFDYILVIKTNGWLEQSYNIKSNSLLNHVVISLAVVSVSVVIFVIRYYLYNRIFDDSKYSLSDKYEYYTGPLKAVYYGHASSPKHYNNAASGGIVSACMIELLNSGKVDGCLLYKLTMQADRLSVVPVIATTEDEVLSCQGSIYIYFSPLSPEVMSLVRNFPGKLAVVGLPCAISALRKKCAKEGSVLLHKIEYMIGLFCGHTSQKKLLDSVLQKKDIKECDIAAFSFRQGKWRGRTFVQLKDSSELSFPSWHYNLYQNLYVYSKPGCLRCSDHFAENADISTGDIWIKKFKSKEIKHSIFVARTQKGLDLIRSTQNTNRINAAQANGELLFRANKRAVIFHKATRAKEIAGKFWGIKIKKANNARPARFNEILAALIFLGTYKLSESRYSNVIFKLPHIFLWIILIVVKLLTNF